MYNKTIGGGGSWLSCRLILSMGMKRYWYLYIGNIANEGHERSQCKGCPLLWALRVAVLPAACESIIVRVSSLRNEITANRRCFFVSCARCDCRTKIYVAPQWL
jgi:hypothetical protein